jgi:hypothetical protein
LLFGSVVHLFTCGFQADLDDVLMGAWHFALMRVVIAPVQCCLSTVTVTAEQLTLGFVL